MTHTHTRADFTKGISTIFIVSYIKKPSTLSRESLDFGKVVMAMVAGGRYTAGGKTTEVRLEQA